MAFGPPSVMPSQSSSTPLPQISGWPGCTLAFVSLQSSLPLGHTAGLPMTTILASHHPSPSSSQPLSVTPSQSSSTPLHTSWALALTSLLLSSQSVAVLAE